MPDDPCHSNIASTQNIDYRPALDRLLRIAKGDTGQARRCADFILAWWNADAHGGFDITDLFAVDSSIAGDMATIFSWLAAQSNAVYPYEWRRDIEAVIEQWRPAASAP